MEYKDIKTYYDISIMHSAVVFLVTTIVTMIYLAGALFLLCSPQLLDLNKELYNYQFISRLFILTTLAIFIGSYVFRYLALNSLNAKLKFITISTLLYLIMNLVVHNSVIVILHTIILIVATTLIIHLTYRPILDLE